MSEGVQEPVFKADGELAVLATEFRVQLLNCSSSGCLIETNARVRVGTIGTLRLEVDGMQFAEQVQIVRCQQIAGAGSVYHLGAQFLWTTVPAAGGSLRRAMWRVPASWRMPSTQPLM
jgi:hypothetical protein